VQDSFSASVEAYHEWMKFQLHKYEVQPFLKNYKKMKQKA
jgi:3-methyladenine DNA glycosylase AlkC